MSKKKVLIIEDSPYLAESLADILNLREYEALVAKNGREGVEMAIESKPDLILLDIRLPDIDGYEVYQRIRSTDWGHTANIMILTASESIEAISKNINLPVDEIMFKPDWSAKELLKKIEEKIEH